MHQHTQSAHLVMHTNMFWVHQARARGISVVAKMAHAVNVVGALGTTSHVPAVAHAVGTVPSIQRTLTMHDRLYICVN